MRSPQFFKMKNEMSFNKKLVDIMNEKMKKNIKFDLHAKGDGEHF
jgi:hypothetical protein